jgi:hypothetical protein
MAGAGVFPKVATSDIVYQTDYNSIQGVIAGVVSTYYGNPVSSSQLSANPTITALAVQQVIADIAKAYRHIAGDLFSPGFTPTVGQTITAAQFNVLKETADFCEANKNSVAAGFGQLATVVDTNTKTDVWNGLRQWRQRYTWATSADATYWFNSGGFFLIDVSGANSSGSVKDNDWQNAILNVIPSQIYTRTNWVNNTNIDVYEYGDYNAYYQTNYCRIFTSKVDDRTLDISVIANDVDTAQHGTVGDAMVTVDLSASITRYYSVDAITSPAVTSAVQINFID